MDDLLPEVPSNQPPAPAPEETRELVVSGNEVYLPDTKRIHPGDPDFKAIVEEVLPEYAPSLSDEALGRPRGYPVWAVILILVFFGSLVAGIFFLRPQVPMVTTSLEVPKPEITKYSGEFYREFREAMDYKDSRKYEDARKCLEPVIDRLLARWEADPEKVKEEERKKVAPVFYSYFDLFSNLPWNDEAGAGERARDHLDRLIKLDSDFRWKLFEIQYQLTRMGGEKLGRLSRHATVASLYKIMGRIDDLRKHLKEDKELTRQLDLYKCYFGLKVWRKLNQNKQDDERGRGDREEVVKITSRYPNDIKFLLVRQYLLKQLIKETRGFYIFDGKEYYLNKHLEFELERVNRVIAKLKEK